MEKKYKPHNGHKNQEYDCRKKHPFNKPGEISFFHLELLRYIRKLV